MPKTDEELRLEIQPRATSYVFPWPGHGAIRMEKRGSPWNFPGVWEASFVTYGVEEQGYITPAGYRMNTGRHFPKKTDLFYSVFDAYRAVLRFVEGFKGFGEDLSVISVEDVPAQ